MKKHLIFITGLLIASSLLIGSCKKDNPQPTGIIQVISVKIGTNTLNLAGSNIGMPVDQPILITLNTQIDSNSAKNSVQLLWNTDIVNCEMTFSQDLKSITLTPLQILANTTDYVLVLTTGLKGKAGETCTGVEVDFKTGTGQLQVVSATLNSLNFMTPPPLRDIPVVNDTFVVEFSYPLDPLNYKSYFSLSGHPPIDLTLSADNKTVTILTADTLDGYLKYFFSVSNALIAENGFTFSGFYNSFYTALDSSLKFPPISDDELLTLVQSQTFKYFYDFAEPVSGMARERNTSGDVVTTGGSGFGVMALIVGMERGFITRQQGLDHLTKITTFLETCDRFHGAWPHWLNGKTGKVFPFSTQDDGADLVETGYMIEGLMTMRQYLNPSVPEEAVLIDRLNGLIDGVEWDWFRHGGQNVLYWHWSPNYGWAINMRIQGYNETQIIYVMAASSTTHTIPPEVYHQGWALNGGIKNGNSYYGYVLPLGWPYGGPLFFTHYSYLGLDPRNLQDQYANYWEQGVNMSSINWAYCADNPKNYVGYRDDCWGLTASDNPDGYGAQSPTDDNGTITPTAAVSALAYTPEQSMAAIRHFYYILGDKLWGEYGFYDAFNVTDGWWADSYIAIDEGPIVCMVENHRTGLLWNLFMSSPEVQAGLDKLGFTY